MCLLFLWNGVEHVCACQLGIVGNLMLLLWLLMVCNGWLWVVWDGVFDADDVWGTVDVFIHQQHIRLHLYIYAGENESLAHLGIRCRTFCYTQLWSTNYLLWSSRKLKEKFQKIIKFVNVWKRSNVKLTFLLTRCTLVLNRSLMWTRNPYLNQCSD